MERSICSVYPGYDQSFSPYAGWTPGGSGSIGGVGIPTGGFEMAGPSLSSQLGIGQRELASRGFLNAARQFGNAGQIYGGVLAQAMQPLPNYAAGFIGAGVGVFAGQNGVNAFCLPPVPGQVWNPVGLVPPQDNSGGGTNVNAGSRAGSADDEAPEVSDKDVSQAEAGLVKDKGLSATEAADVVALAKEASGGNLDKFNAIMEGYKDVPSRNPPDDLTTDAQRAEYEAKWQQAHAAWYAKHVGGLSVPQTKEFVDQAVMAPGGGTSGKVTLKFLKKDGKALKYEVTKAEAGSGLTEKQIIFFVDSKWCAKDKRTPLEVTELPTPTADKPEKEFPDITVHAPAAKDAVDDYATVQREPGIVEITVDGLRKKFEKYRVISKSGPEASNIQGDTVYLVRNAGEWYVWDGNAANKPTKLGVQPKFSYDHKRLVFKAAPRGKVPFIPEDIPAFNKHLREKLAEYKEGLASAKADEQAFIDESVVKLQEEWTAVGSPTTDALQIQQGPDNKVEIAVVDPAKLDAAIVALEGKKDDLDRIFGRFPTGAKVVCNGQRIDTGKLILPQLLSALEGVERELTIDDMVDLKAATPPGGPEAVLKAAITKAMTAKHNNKPTKVVITRQVTLPDTMTPKELQRLTEKVAKELGLRTAPQIEFDPSKVTGAVYKKLTIPEKIDLTGKDADAVKAAVLKVIQEKMAAGGYAANGLAIVLSEVVLPSGMKEKAFQEILRAIETELTLEKNAISTTKVTIATASASTGGSTSATA